MKNRIQLPIILVILIIFINNSEAEIPPSEPHYVGDTVISQHRDIVLTKIIELPNTNRTELEMIFENSVPIWHIEGWHLWGLFE